MGKYDGLNIDVSENYETNMFLRIISNELAEMNRLKRLEMSKYVGVKMNVKRSEGINEFKPEELEDKA